MSYKLNMRSAIEFPDSYTPASRDSRFVSIRNGTIDLARGDRTLMAVSFVDEWDYAREYVTKRPSVRTATRDQPNMNIPYIRSEHLFEGLKLLAHDIAIGVEGSHTVIRNCIIESSSNAAIFIAGPNVTIENCDIRLRATEDEWYVEKNSTRAAIALRDGSNAVIRNNRIRVDYGGSVPTKTHCILVRDGARDVLVEGNTFLNVRGKPVTLTEGSEAVERNNQMKRAG